jgi:hypothetical protein
VEHRTDERDTSTVNLDTGRSQIEVESARAGHGLMVPHKAQQDTEYRRLHAEDGVGRCAVDANATYDAVFVQGEEHHVVGAGDAG